MGRQRFQDRLDDLRESVLAMADLVRDRLEMAIEALDTGDEAAAREVLVHDTKDRTPQTTAPVPEALDVDPHVGLEVPFEQPVERRGLGMARALDVRCRRRRRPRGRRRRSADQR